MQPSSSEYPSSKKVLFFITKSSGGGAGRYVFDLASNLPKAYQPVIVSGGTGLLLQKAHEEHIRTFEIAGLARDISLLKELRTFLSFYRILKEEKPHILHLNSSKAGGLGALAGRAYNLRARITQLFNDKTYPPTYIVFTAHAWAFNEDRPLWQKGLIAFFHYTTILLSHTTITVSHALHRQTRHFPFVQNKIHTIHLGIDPNTPILPREEVREYLAREHAIPEEVALVCTIAELHPIKRIEVLIEAISEIIKNETSPIHLVIFGEGELRGQLEQLVEDLNIAQFVHFLGFVPEAAKYLRSADVFVLPSKSEALGYVLLEAGLAERAVVASCVGGIPEIIEHTKTGLLSPPDNLEALAESMQTLLKDPELRAQYGEALQRRVVDDFTLEHMIKNTVAIYRSCV